MSRRITKIIPLDEPVARFQSPDECPQIARYTEVLMWVEEPDRYIYDKDTLIHYEWPTNRKEVVPNPIRELNRRTRRSLGFSLWQPKTITMDVWEVYERIDRLVTWTDELMGPQGRKETVERTYETFRLPDRSTLRG